MAEVNMQKAKEIFDALVDMLDTRDWKYEKFEEDLVIKSGIKGDDLPIEFIVVVKPKNQVVQLLSRLPFRFPKRSAWMRQSQSVLPTTVLLTAPLTTTSPRVTSPSA